MANFLPNFMRQWRGTFVVTLFFVTLASGLFWLDFFRGYQTETEVIVVSHTPEALTALETLKSLAGTLSFYDRVLSQNETLEDALSGAPPLERKAGWQALVSVRQKEKGSILSIAGKGKTIEESRLWTAGTVEALLGSASFYYDVRSEVDLRIIDGPFTKRVLDRPFAYGFATVGSGVLLTAVFFILLKMFPLLFAKTRSFLSKKKGREEEKPEEIGGYHVGESVPLIDPRTFVPSRPRGFDFPDTRNERREAPSEPRTALARAEAPFNLPVADEPAETFYQEESVPENLPFAPADHAFVSQESHDVDENGFPAGPEIPKVAEPTIEEYKARLNKLLANGKD